MFNIKKIGSSLLIASLLVGCANQNSQMNRRDFMIKINLTVITKFHLLMIWMF